MLTRPEHSRPRPRPHPKAKAKAKAMAIPMQRLTMKYEVMKSSFFEYSYKDKHSLITSLITDMIRRNE